MYFCVLLRRQHLITKDLINYKEAVKICKEACMGFDVFQRGD
jgi:hypothetical protein